MTESSTTSDVQVLIQEGNAALRAGDMIEARKHFRRASELEPENIEAWLGMAGAVRPFAEKREYLQRALDIDPTHAGARGSMEYVENRLAAGDMLAPSAAPETAPQTASTDQPAASVETLYCYRHPDRETGLRCVQCSRPICTDCVRPAFVGQLCPECARERRPRNYQVSPTTLLLAGLLTFGISLLLSMLVVWFVQGWLLILAFFAAPAAAEMIVRVLDRVTRAKRGREMQLTIGLSYGLGAAPWLLLLIILSSNLPLELLLFTVIATVTLVGRLR